jgi:helicase
MESWIQLYVLRLIYDQFKGDSELTGFDVKNIKGRAGRFLSHFIGNIYSLVPLKHEENKGVIEFSFYDNENLDIEDVLQIDKKDLLDSNLIKRKKLEEQLLKLSIPIAVIKENKFIGIHKQITLIKHLRQQSSLIEQLSFQGNLPSSNQLREILLLCAEYLFTKQHREDKNYTINQLIRLTQFYVYRKPSIKELISDFGSENIDTRVRNAFNLISNYFEFALPKYLTAFENIFNFVARERGIKKELNLTFLITVLEFGHSEIYEIALKEAGLPNDIIKKVAKSFNDCNSLEQIRTKFLLDQTIINKLTPFERKIFRRYI